MCVSIGLWVFDLGQDHCKTDRVPVFTCDVVLLEGVTVDLVLIGTVFLQPFTHVLLAPQGHGFGQLHSSRLGKGKI